LAKKLAIAILIIVSISSIFVILAIAEGSSSDENTEWGSLFGRTLAQDWIVTPLIFMILTLVVSDSNTTKILSKKIEADERVSTEEGRPMKAKSA